MKTNGNGQAKILSDREMDRLFSVGLETNRDKALFAVCRFTGCRISEALQLKNSDIDFQGNLIIFRRATTKGKLASRSMTLHPELKKYLMGWDSPSEFLFPGENGSHLTRGAADLILREACNRLKIRGVSTHSFRRTALTKMSNAGIPLRVIQEISGHKSLAALQRYLEVDEGQVSTAIAIL